MRAARLFAIAGIATAILSGVFLERYGIPVAVVMLMTAYSRTVAKHGYGLLDKIFYWGSAFFFWALPLTAVGFAIGAIPKLFLFLYHGGLPND